MGAFSSAAKASFAHLLLLALAVSVFTIGTSIGLQVSTAAGSALWILAAAIMASNVAWVIWRVLRQRGHAKDQS